MGSLSEDRIRYLATRIAGDLLRTRAVETRAPEAALARKVGLALRNGAFLDAEIDAEARNALKKKHRVPPENTPAWREMYERTRQEILERKRRGG